MPRGGTERVAKPRFGEPARLTVRFKTHGPASISLTPATSYSATPYAAIHYHGASVYGGSPNSRYPFANLGTMSSGIADAQLAVTIPANGWYIVNFTGYGAGTKAAPSRWNGSASEPSRPGTTRHATSSWRLGHSWSFRRGVTISSSSRPPGTSMQPASRCTACNSGRPSRCAAGTRAAPVPGTRAARRISAFSRAATRWERATREIGNRSRQRAQIDRAGDGGATSCEHERCRKLGGVTERWVPRGANGRTQPPRARHARPSPAAAVHS
jgi:hypothetical protein